MKARLKELEYRFVHARTDAERDAISHQIHELCEADAPAVAAAALENIRETNAEAAEIVLREQLRDVIPAVSLAYIAKTYFSKTRQWLYQRINGTSVNGKPARFTPEEVEILNHALKDIGNRLCSLRVSS